ncbi:hypothetical protein [Hymenobacter koreensis]|uniref:Lipoprotein n=1 Tax=Hymenobacter koreensis TaxID=1084523 RepID=A0ABP8IY45_9BACT
MKQTFLLFTLLVSFNACKKEEKGPSTEHIAVAFSQEFTLNYQQAAHLPEVAAPAARVLLQDITDTRCPSSMRCFSPGVAEATVRVLGSQSGDQTVVVRAFGEKSVPDSATVQVNGSRYTLLIRAIEPGPTASEYAKKEQGRATLRLLPR